MEQQLLTVMSRTEPESSFHIGHLRAFNVLSPDFESTFGLLALSP
jgi:hypothetical protein